MSKHLSNKFLQRAAMTIIFCLAAGVASTSAQSQASTGQITGVVTDPNGAVVPNATVTATNKGTNQTQTQTTSDEGVYRFVLLQPGQYTVTTSSSGFAQQNLDVEVQVGRTTDANITLGAAGATAQVEVTAEGVQTTTSNSDAVIDETSISNLPINGRRFQDFVTLTPGAQVGLGGDTRGQISLSGQRGINSNINVDGVDFNQPFFGGIRGGERSNAAFTIPQESIKEFNVVAAGYSAEFGRSSGGIVNAVTKSGTNDLRGTAFYLWRPEQLARPNKYAKALQNQRLSAITVNGQQGVDATLAPTQHQFGGSVGGPIIKDKLFYFGSYEQQRFKAPRQVLYGNLVGVTPTAQQLDVFNYYRAQELPFEQTNNAFAGLAKIDWQVNNDHRFNIRFNYSRNNALNAVSTGETSFDPTTNRALSTNGTEKNRNIGTVGQLASNFGANIFNELRFQIYREDRPRLANELAPNVFTGIGEFGTRNFLPTTQFDTRYQVADNLTFLNGDHTFKFGGEYSRLYAKQTFGFGQTGEYSLTGQSTTNTLTLLSNTQFPAAFPTFLGRFDIANAVYRQQIGNLQAAIKVHELAFFAQDSWRLTPRLTINYGLRAEQQYNPDPDTSNTDLVNLVKNAQFPLRGGKGYDPTQIPDSGWQIGPRLGFAYDPQGDGKTVIRGFAGYYYARTPLLLLADSINNFRLPPGNVRAILGSGGVTVNQTAFNQFLTTPAANAYRQITGCNPTGTAAQIAFCTPNTIYRQFAIIGINLNNSAIGSLPTLTPQQVQQIGAAINPSFNPNIISGIAVTGHDENFKNPRSFQFGFAVERELGRNFVVGIDFSQVKTNRLQRNVDLNLPAPILLDPTLDPAQRPYFGISRPAFLPTSVALRNRPITQLSNVQIRESSAKSLYRALTFRTRLARKWGQLNAYYTLSKSLSDDDNERDSGGVLYPNAFDRSREYGPSRIDRTHQFTANPVFFLPFGFEISSAVRLRSGTPVNVIVNSDLNGDGLNNDRPFIVPGYEIKRNAYRNRPVYDVDLRAQKGFRFDETKRLIFSAEFFNVFNLSNVQLGTTNVTSYCTGAAATLGRCGLDGITNINFLQVRDQNPTSSTFGQLIVANNPGSQVFQVQFGARFQF